ncbi:hypothetical protein [Chthonobacter rhizosphaerae]|uniref:hypothetical protein n=1 Tax=Chthonobacter rhizosphaerae TaxID=2735553 RepID=UPI0015EF7401|nr:hypothetical protein [Chthonobacter rhizosphaerae]
MFVEIAFTFCLLTAPADCRVETQPFDGPMMACALLGQQAARDWLESHPKWRMTKWRCGVRDPIRTATAT